MKLYCIPNCAECENVKKFIKDSNSKVEIVELEFINNKYVEKTSDGYNEIGYYAFPVLYFGDIDGKACSLIGDDGIIDYLKKGFVHTSKMCPMFQKACIEKECEMFSILRNGLIPEGNCSLKWIPILSTELISATKEK